MTPIRLCSVSGHEGRINDVLFHPPATPSDLTSTVVFFGGDVQDFPEVMESHRDNRNYLKWNLENMATLLSHNFPKSNILVVRPSRIEFKSFSCYDNFVPSNNAGVPDHTPTHYALHHLERLLQGVTHRLKAMPTSELTDALSFLANQEDIDIDVLQDGETNAPPAESAGAPCEMTDASATHYANSTGVIQTPHAQPPTTTAHTDENSRLRQGPEQENPLWWREGLALDKSALTLVGFSKGCVVLNQLIYEFHYVKTLTPDDAVMMRFMQRIVSMYWLDGGHAGGKNTWITSRSLLETLTRLDVNIFVHVSPYQIQDERRPWIGREERAFMKLLRDLGAKVCRYMHQQANTPQTLQTHFEVLTSFKQLQDTTAPCPPPDSSDES